MNEFDYEPEPGLPARLPAGERVLWRATPQWWPFARSAFHARFLIGYFAVLVSCQVAAVAFESGSLSRVAGSAAWMLALATVALLVALAFGWIYSRSTVYTLTDRRLVMRFGVAVPLAVNLPLSVIDAAELKLYGDGSGDIALCIAAAQRVGVVQMWPCVQVWRLLAPRPVLRAVPDAARVAALLAQALTASDVRTTTSPSHAATELGLSAGLAT